MTWIKTNIKGILLCLIIAVPSWIIGNLFPIIGGAVISMLIGMAAALFIKNKRPFEAGIKFTSKKILQLAVIMLGFGMNLSVVLETGAQSLPIIISTISVSLIVAYILHRALKIPGKISALIGVGSSICGGSAIAAAAPVVDADDDEIAQSISVIFLFNVIAAIVFPVLGTVIGFSTTDGTPFGIFAGTAVNDTSSVTAAASSWDGMWGLGTQTLDKAVTVKLTRTLAIIPITLVLALLRARRSKNGSGSVKFSKIFPFFILFFIAASVVTTLCVNFGISESLFSPFKTLSKFLIVLAMAAIGLNTDIINLIKKGGKPIIMGLCCCAAIAGTSLIMQHFMNLI